jgi:hypothetical protein
VFEKTAQEFGLSYAEAVRLLSKEFRHFAVGLRPDRYVANTRRH